MKSFNYTLLVSLSIFIFSIGTHAVHALTLSPVKVEVTGNPGQTLRGELDMMNEQSFTKTFFSSFENFEPSGDTGSPKFIGADDGLATWMQTDQTVTVSPGQKIKIPYTITIPVDAEPGGYFAAIFWGEDNPAANEGGEVSIGGKLGALVLLRVSGDITEAAGIQEFTTVDGKKLFTSLPVAFSYRFKNDGGDRVVPLGDIAITNIFGSTVTLVKANPSEGSVLPDSTRKFSTAWGTVVKDAPAKSFMTTVKEQATDFHLGYYSAKLSLTYGVTNKTAESSVWFIFFPWQLLLLTFSGISLMVGIVRVYTVWIIARSKSKA